MSEPMSPPVRPTRLTRIVVRVALIATALFLLALLKMACRDDAAVAVEPSSEPEAGVPSR